MLSRITRITMLLVLGATVFAAMPKASEAQYAWYNPGVWQYRAFRPILPWRRRAVARTAYRPVIVSPTTVYRPVMAYRPVIAASSCNTCSPCATTVRYAPQTCYRPQIVSVPTVRYQAVRSCDACSGCCHTVMRPVTTYVRHVRQVAYTTYRPVYASNCSTCTTCASPCSTCGVVGCTTCSATSSCASGQCNSGSTIHYPEATSTPANGSGLERPSLLNESQKVDAQKTPTESEDRSNPQAEPDTGEMQEIGGARLQKFDPPKLLDPLDRQARAGKVRHTSYQQPVKVQPSLPLKWEAVK